MGAWEDFLSKNAIAPGSGLANEIQNNPELAKNYGWTGGGASSGAGGGLSALSEDRSAIGDYIAGDPYALPDADVAMGEQRALQRKGISGLSALLDEGLDPRRQAIEDAIYDKSADSIRYESGNLFRKGLEDTFGRGMGKSTVTQDYVLQPLERETMDAVGRARRDAVIGSGAEARADLSARLGALGQATTAGTNMLQADANVGLADANRQQTARTTGSTLATSTGLARLAREQQESQFGRELTSREDLQNKAFANAKDIASSNSLTSGIAGGLSGLAQIFAPSANRLLERSGF